MVEQIEQEPVPLEQAPASTKKKSNALNKIFRRPVNPEYKNFIEGHIAQLLLILADFQQGCSKHDGVAKALMNQLVDIEAEIKSTQGQIFGYFDKIKYFTETTEAELKNLEYNLRALLKTATLLRDVFIQTPETAPALEFVSTWHRFQADLKIISWHIERPTFPYLFYAVFGLAFVFVPFLNLISLFVAIYLVSRKDYRAIILGSATLVLFFVQWINVVILWL